MFEQFRKKFRKFIDDAVTGSYDAPVSDSPEYSNGNSNSERGEADDTDTGETSVSCSVCGGPLEKPDVYMGQPTGPLVVRQCRTCDRIPRGKW